MKKVLSGLFLVLAASLALSAQSQSVKVEVDGLSCPFCAYGLEKKFKDIKGVENIHIDVQQGLLTFTVKAGIALSEEQIRKTVKKAGFTARKITFSEAEEKTDHAG